MGNYHNKVMVITGASSGIGRATALEFARNGGSVVLAARRREALEELEQECRHIGGRASAVPTDMSKEEEVKALVIRAMEEMGHIDIWVNNAAVTIMGPFEETPLADMRRLIDVNIMGYINGAHTILPHFRERGKGTLINVSSMVALTGQPFSVAYSMSKFAIRGLSLSLEQEYSDVAGIHVCSVLPSVIDTPIFNQAANYMGREVKAPEPVNPAQEVAESIIKLVDKPEKETIVGNMGRLMKVMRKAAPGLYDKKIRKMIIEDHFRDIVTSPSPGNLYEPNPAFARQSGGWQEEGSTEPAVDIKKVGYGALLTAAAVLGTTLLLRNGFFRNGSGNKRKEVVT